MDYGMVSPYSEDGTLITPLTTGEFAAPRGSDDKLVQVRSVLPLVILLLASLVASLVTLL